MPTEVLHTRDHAREGSRAFLRLELTDDHVIVVVHEVGPHHVREDSDASRDAWQAWQARLEPPTLTDDLGTTYTLSPVRRARGQGGSPSKAPIPMKATISWHFIPPPSTQVGRWTIDGRWAVGR